MPQMITIGGLFRKSLLRINGVKNIIEVSENGGKTWSSRFISNSCGIFRDLLYYKNLVFACTDRGLYVSANDGKTFSSRFISSSIGQFVNLQDNGKEIIATTSKGLFWSSNEGKTWSKR